MPNRFLTIGEVALLQREGLQKIPSDKLELAMISLETYRSEIAIEEDNTWLDPLYFAIRHEIEKRKTP